VVGGLRLGVIKTLTLSDKVKKRSLAQSVPALFNDITVCETVVFSGSLCHLIALGETANELVELSVFGKIMKVLISHHHLTQQ